MPQKGAQHTTMSDEVRIALCKHKEDHPDVTQKELMKWLEDTHNIKISQATISTTIKRSAELLARTDGNNLKAKRQRNVKYPAMEAALAEWFYINREHINLSGDLVRSIAMKILDRTYPEHEPFEFSNGWLDRFKARHGIRSLRRLSESGSVDVTAVTNALPGIRAFLDQYDWKDIYNVDKTGLFYRMQADYSLATKQLEGQKENKERITLTVCCNGDGSDKLPLWVVGKFKEPRCLKNINMATLSCQYRNNTKAFMTPHIFMEWLFEFDLHVSGRKVILLMDKCVGHFPHIQLCNTTIFYFPPNMTSKIQPCNAGIICNLKACYRRRFNRMLLRRLEDGVDYPEKINVLAGIQMATEAWRSDVKQSTIANCFLHCDIRTTDQPAEKIGKVDLVDPLVLHDVQAQINQLQYHNPMDITDFVTYPYEQVTSYTPAIKGKIKNRLERRAGTAEGVDSEDDSEDIPAVRAADAYKMVEALEWFWMQQTDSNVSFVNALQEMKDSISMPRIDKTDVNPS